MYSGKSVVPRMDLCRTPTLTGYSCEDFPSKTTQSRLLQRIKKKAKYLTWNSVRLKFVKKTSKPNSVKSLGYIKYSSNSPRPVTSFSNFIRYNFQKICSWSRRPKTILEIRKRSHFSRRSTILLFISFSKTLLSHYDRSRFFIRQDQNYLLL